MEENGEIEKKKKDPANFAETPLRGREMEIILRKSGVKNREFAEAYGGKPGAWTLNHYQKSVVPLKIAIALREFIGPVYFDTYLQNYRDEREAIILKNAGLMAAAAAKKKK